MKYVALSTPTFLLEASSVTTLKCSSAFLVSARRPDISNNKSLCVETSASAHADLTVFTEFASCVVAFIAAGIICFPAISIIAL